MSSSNDLIVAWKTAELYFFRVVGPVTILIGSVGCIVNLLVFTQKSLRKNPCAIYFIAFNLANFLFICSLLLQLTLGLGYSINPTIYVVVICRLSVYSSVLFNTLSPFYLLLASIDRSLLTSRNARTRRRSTRCLALVSVALGTIFWALFHIHVYFFSTVLQFSSTFYVCYFPRGAYRSFISYYLLMKEIIALVLMILCGVWSIRNVRHLNRVGVAEDRSITRMGAPNNIHLTSSKDRQMILMLLLDIIIYVLFSFSYGIVLSYQQITQTHIKSIERTEIERVITNLCLFSICIPCCSSCYANLVASKTFRKEVKKILF